MGGPKGVGLYADQNRVYALHLSKQMGRVGLLGYAEADIVPTPDGQIDNRAFSDALRVVMAKAGIRERDVAAALPGKDAIIRYFEMPLIPKKEWPAAVRFEAQKYMTLNTDDLYFNYEVFPHKESKKLEVVFLASPKDTVSRIMSLYFDAGLNMHALEPVSVSLFRAFAHEKPVKEGDVRAIIDTHNDGTINVLIVKGAVLLMARDSVILKSPDGSPEGVRVPDFRALMTEVNLSFNYFIKHFVNEEIRSVHLLLDTNEIFRDWDRRLSAELGLPVETGTLSGLFAQSKEYSPGRTIAMGLALRELSDSLYKDSNLIPADIAKTTRKVFESQAAVRAQKTAAPGAPASSEDNAVLKKWALIAGGVALAALALAFAYFQVTLNSKESEYKMMRLKAPATLTVTDRDTDAAGLKLIESRLYQQHVYLSQFIDKRLYWTQKLSEIAKLVPPTIQIVSIEAVDMTGKTGTPAASVKIDGKLYPGEGMNPLLEVNRFAEALRKNSTFMRGMTDVKINSIRRGIEDINFTVDCIAKDRK